MRALGTATTQPTISPEIGNLLERYPLGEPEMSSNPRNIIVISSVLLDDLLEQDGVGTVGCSLGSAQAREQKEKGRRKKEEPWLVMAFTSASVIR